ncbi:hypothetical protein LG275_01725 [Chryseomicrobium palamuruense]
MLKEQKGYALLITLILVILISILALAMLTTNLSASTQNSTRETVVQAEDMAVKGLEYFTTSLQNELEKSINNSRLTVPEYINRLKTVLQDSKYQCINGSVDIPTELAGTTSTCIEKIYLEGNQNPNQNQLNDSLKWIVVIKSTSVVNDQTRTVRQHLLYGTDNVPDQLRYALSSNDRGNLYLHGGIDIYGDVKTEGNLILSDTAFWKSGSNVRWVDSLAPRIMSKNFTPKVILPTNSNYNVYTMKSTNEISTSNFDSGHITGKYFGTLNNNSDRNFYNKHYIKHNINASNDVQQIKNYLTDGNAVSFERRSLPTDTLNISNEIANQKNTAKYRNLSNFNIVRNSDSRFFADKNNTFYFGSTTTSCSWQWEGWRLVWKCVDNESVSNLTINSNISNQAINLKGIYYITGDLVITNTVLSSDAIFYVNGTVNMTNSTIVDGSNLFVFSNGEIEISNMSVDLDTPSKIKGFFYTKENFLMYGVGSNINLYGGISAKRIILTGIRGFNRNGSYPTVTTQSSYINNQRIPSRLIIDYDPSLIPEFISFIRPADTEITPTMNPPIVIEQEITAP